MRNYLWRAFKAYEALREYLRNSMHKSANARFMVRVLIYAYARVKTRYETKCVKVENIGRPFDEEKANYL